VIDATVKMPGGDDNFAAQSVLTFSIVVTISTDQEMYEDRDPE